MIFMHYFLLPARICCCKFYNNLTGKGFKYTCLKPCMYNYIIHVHILNIVIVIHWYTGFYAKSVKNLSTPDMTIESTISTIYDYYTNEPPGQGQFLATSIDSIDIYMHAILIQ